MRFNILAFRIPPTFVRARHRVALAHWPVVADEIFIRGCIIITVVTAESQRSLGARLTLVSVHVTTLEVLTTMGARNIRKLTANKLLAQFRVQIQVPIQFSQLPGPSTAAFLMHATHTKCIQ